MLHVKKKDWIQNVTCITWKVLEIECIITIIIVINNITYIK